MEPQTPPLAVLEGALGQVGCDTAVDQAAVQPWLITIARGGSQATSLYKDALSMAEELAAIPSPQALLEIVQVNLHGQRATGDACA